MSDVHLASCLIWLLWEISAVGNSNMYKERYCTCRVEWKDLLYSTCFVPPVLV